MPPKTEAITSLISNVRPGIHIWQISYKESPTTNAVIILIVFRSSSGYLTTVKPKKSSTTARKLGRESARAKEVI